MNSQLIQIKALDKKLAAIKPLVPVIPRSQSWIRTLRNALGMTARQLAKRIGISQSRVAYMEQNERNLKISTLEKIAQSMNCTFVPLFIPIESLEFTLKKQAQTKACEMLASVNQNMSLENQLITSQEILSDMTEDLLRNNKKQLWG